MSDALICGHSPDATGDACLDCFRALRTECERLRGVLERIGNAPDAECYAAGGIARAALAATPRTVAPVLDPVEAILAAPCPACACPAGEACVSGDDVTRGQFYCAARIRSLASRPPRGGSHAK